MSRQSLNERKSVGYGQNSKNVTTSVENRRTGILGVRGLRVLLHARQ